MAQLSPEAIWKLSEAELLALLETGAFKSRCSIIRFYAPSFAYYKTKHFSSSTIDFPTISVTGNACALDCKHCGGKVLENMHDAPSPEELFEVARKLKRDGAEGCLISGGCLPDGSGPLDAFVPTLARIKWELGLTVFVHTGIIKPQVAFALKDAGVDAALIDVVGSAVTAREVYNLNISVQDYADSLAALEDAKLTFVPHIIVGLNDGKLDGELRALQIICQVKPSALVIIAFMPIHGTAMEKTSPPKPVDIAKVSVLARQMFPTIPLALGCMRPKGEVRGEMDVLALKAGVDAVAFPTEAAIEYAKSKVYSTVFSSYCCAQICVDSTE